MIVFCLAMRVTERSSSVSCWLSIWLMTDRSSLNQPKMAISGPDEDSHAHAESLDDEFVHVLTACNMKQTSADLFQQCASSIVVAGIGWSTGAPTQFACVHPSLSMPEK